MSAIAQKVRQLLKLAEGNANEHEAAAALGAAQKLMEAHAIDAAMLDESTDAEDETVDVWEDPLDPGSSSKLPRWKWNLACYLAKYNGCFLWGTRKSGKRGIGIAGRAQDAQTVRYLYAYCVREVDRLASRYAGNGRTWLNNYRYGVVDTIAKQLRTAHEAARTEARTKAGAGTALVRVNDALVKIDARATRAADLAYKKLKLRAGSGGGNARGNLDARMRGREDGKAVKLGHKGQLGGGRGRLPQ